MRDARRWQQAMIAAGVVSGMVAGAPARAEEAATATAGSETASSPAPDPGSGIAEGSQIVVTATRVNQIAPTTASLDSKQPQSIVSRSLIEDSLPATADFNQIALITPSVSNLNGNNGVGLSESKAQIRGFQDGEYNITMDGVPFADTNDPTHHSTTFWPSNTIETVVVDRGPGNASQLGQATFGGNINLFSRVARDDFGGQIKASYGSFDTYLGRVLLNTGEFAGGAKGVLTGQYVHTDGALSFEKYRNYNVFGKVVVPISSDVSLTFLGSYNNNKFNQPDKDGSTLFQQARFGKYFSLNDDPKTPQYFGFNHTTKVTDFEIATLDAHISPTAEFTNQAYTYYYDNETLSALDVTGGTANTTTLADGKTKAIGDVPGYTKTNRYRVYGDIAKLRLGLTDWATLTAGVWLEWSKTYRQQTDVDLTTGGFNYIEKAVIAPPPPAIATNPGAATPLYVKFDQDSRGNQANEFAELELRPLDGLTITPGFKHVDFTRQIFAAYNQTTRYAQNLSSSYSANLPFAQANWAITPRLAAYAEFARGFLAPPLSAIYVANPDFSDVRPEKSRNLQAGAVYHGDKLSLDADVYDIKFTNKFVSLTSPIPGVGTVFTNIGGARYRGVEGQIAYAITPSIAVFANGSLNDAKANDTDRQIAYAPKGTAAGGVIVKMGPFKASLIDKYTGPQYAVQADAIADPTFAKYQAYRIRGYNSAVLAASYHFGPIEIGGEVTNLFNSKRVTQINGSFKNALSLIGTPSASNFDQYYYQAPRAVTGEVTLYF